MAEIQVSQDRFFPMKVAATICICPAALNSCSLEMLVDDAKCNRLIGLLPGRRSDAQSMRLNAVTAAYVASELWTQTEEGSKRRSNIPWDTPPAYEANWSQLVLCNHSDQMAKQLTEWLNRAWASVVSMQIWLSRIRRSLVIFIMTNIHWW